MKFLGLLAAACLGAGGCEGGVEDTADAGTSTGDASTGDASTGDATGDTSTGGPTTGEPEPSLELTRITDPSWEVVDFHQSLVEIGGEWEQWSDRTVEALPMPGHAPHPDLGIGPGAPHPGPYDHEFADSWAHQGWVDSFVYGRAESFKPNAVMSVFMVTPGADAPVGKTPDSDAGPMIPHTIFPIKTTFENLADGQLVLGGTSTFDVLPLDQIDPPFAVDGHSHFPMFSGRTLDGEPVTDGPYETQVTMIDNTGSGWKIKFGFIVHD